MATRPAVATAVLLLTVATAVTATISSNGRHATNNVSDPIPAAAAITTSSWSQPAAVPAADRHHLAIPRAQTPAPRAPGKPIRLRVAVGVIPVPQVPHADIGPIPALAWSAYHRAAATSGCGLPWYVLAGIGKIESDHGRYGGSHLDSQGTVTPSILGPGTAWGRAEGPMQFLASTWARYATDGNADGVRNPQNIFDETKAAAHYLCVAGGSDLSGTSAQQRAVFAYNHLDTYVQDVLGFAHAYALGLPESTVRLVPIVYPTPPATPAKAKKAAVKTTSAAPKLATKTKTAVTSPTSHAGTTASASRHPSHTSPAPSASTPRTTTTPVTTTTPHGPTATATATTTTDPSSPKTTCAPGSAVPSGASGTGATCAPTATPSGGH